LWLEERGKVKLKSPSTSNNERNPEEREEKETFPKYYKIFKFIDAPIQLIKHAYLYNLSSSNSSKDKANLIIMA